MYRDEYGHPGFAIYPLSQFRLECKSEEAESDKEAVEVKRMDGEVYSVTPGPDVHDEANDGTDK